MFHAFAVLQEELIVAKLVAHRCFSICIAWYVFQCHHMDHCLDMLKSLCFMPCNVLIWLIWYCLFHLQPLCRSDPMLVLESSLYVLERNPSETIELFLSENVPADLVNSYLKQHAPNLQSTYLELMLSMSETGINPNLQNELVCTLSIVTALVYGKFHI